MSKDKAHPDAVTLGKTAAESANDYADALIDACAKAGGVDPAQVIEETAAHPKVVAIEMVEFIVGWFHGCAEAHDVAPVKLWRQVAATRPAPEPPNGKRPAKPAPAKAPPTRRDRGARAAPAADVAALAKRPPKAVMAHPEPVERELAVSIALAAPTPAAAPKRRTKRATAQAALPLGPA